MPKSNIDFWQRKISRNKSRDKNVTDYYKSINWNVFRIWEHDLVENEEITIEQLVKAIKDIKENEV